MIIWTVNATPAAIASILFNQLTLSTFKIWFSHAVPVCSCNRVSINFANVRKERVANTVLHSCKSVINIGSSCQLTLAYYFNNSMILVFFSSWTWSELGQINMQLCSLLCTRRKSRPQPPLAVTHVTIVPKYALCIALHTVALAQQLWVSHVHAIYIQRLPGTRNSMFSSWVLAPFWPVNSRFNWLSLVPLTQTDIIKFKHKTALLKLIVTILQTNSLALQKP